MNQDAAQREPAPVSKLALGQVVPPFVLTDSNGRQFNLWDYKARRNLVLFFFHGSRCAACRDVLTGFASHYRAYRDLDAEVIAVSREPLSVVRALAEGLRLPFPVLSDPKAEVSNRFLQTTPGNGPLTAALYVTDRYGALFHQVVAESDAAIPSQKTIQQWLQFIGIQCEECGVPEWPAE